jgi:hypothetical protein
MKTKPTSGTSRKHHYAQDERPWCASPDLVQPSWYSTSYFSKDAPSAKKLVRDTRKGRS